jgi:hypothetical protein
MVQAGQSAHWHVCELDRLGAPLLAVGHSGHLKRIALDGGELQVCQSFWVSLAQLSFELRRIPRPPPVTSACRMPLDHVRPYWIPWNKGNLPYLRRQVRALSHLAQRVVEAPDMTIDEFVGLFCEGDLLIADIEALLLFPRGLLPCIARLLRVNLLSLVALWRVLGSALFDGRQRHCTGRAVDIYAKIIERADAKCASAPPQRCA